MRESRQDRHERAVSHVVPAADPPPAHCTVERGQCKQSGGSARPPCLDQEPLSVGDARPLGLDPVVQPGEPASTIFNRETGNGPEDLPEKVDNRANVNEHGAQGLLSEIDHDETGCRSRGDSSLRVPSLADRLGAHHEVGELAVRACTDLLRQVGPAGLEHTGDLVPKNHGGVSAHDEVEGLREEGQIGVVGYLDHRDAERAQVPFGQALALCRFHHREGGVRRQAGTQVGGADRAGPWEGRGLQLVGGRAAGAACRLVLCAAGCSPSGAVACATCDSWL